LNLHEETYFITPEYIKDFGRAGFNEEEEEYIDYSLTESPVQAESSAGNLPIVVSATTISEVTILPVTVIPPNGTRSQSKKKSAQKKTSKESGLTAIAKKWQTILAFVVVCQLFECGKVLTTEAIVHEFKIVPLCLTNLHHQILTMTTLTKLY